MPGFIIFLTALWCLALTAPSFAYVDPGMLGTISQLFYLVFYAIAGVALFFFRPIKKFFMKLFNIREKPAQSENEESPKDEGKDQD